MAWSGGGPKEAAVGEGASLPSPALTVGKGGPQGGTPSLVQAEQPLGTLDAVYKEVSGTQSPPAAGGRKPSGGASPAASVDWQGLPMYNPAAIGYALHGPVAAREGLQGGLVPARALYETPLQSRSRERKGGGGGDALVKWWLLMLMTLNTLASCWGLWELRQRTAQIIHAQEAALGELTDTIRRRVLPVFDQNLFPDTLLPSPMDSLTRQLFNEWAGTRDEGPPTVQNTEEETTSHKPRPPRLPLHAGNLEQGRQRRQTHLPDFLLSPTVPTGPSPSLVDIPAQSPLPPKWSSPSDHP
ncbi:hypothetical protein, conserved [Eimeria acervulina]|uniref:Uncharacterized protein n=1 Tax=Eimeria acervulina TaxID=5801 RepID=U6G9V1_EIMAC|nr:hypothetical protein, conserved [Eimeria acervulina]CDI76322.1 hypothetical protein, conserved [Eimeria acervulina]